MTMDNKMRPDLEPLPARMSALKINDAGYPVPFFVAWVDGKPEFRAADSEKLSFCIRSKACWVCGEPLGRFMTFVVGPMCGINRTSAEPPSHLECGQWSARNCPFLSNSTRRRREDDVINNANLEAHSPGLALTRNPGVTLLWTTRKYSLFGDGRGGVLFDIGEPARVEFYFEGRPATREQIEHSVQTGLPRLAEMAEYEGPQAVAQLAAAVTTFSKFLPAQAALAAG